MSALRVDGLSVGYPKGPAVVHGIDLSVAPGERVVLLGPSGAGKTTLLRAIAGFERPRAGRIRVGGDDVARVPPEKRGVGYVFQGYALFPHLTVRKNIGFGLGRAHPDRAARVNAMLELVELSDFADRLPNALSGGQQQRVALARAIAPKPPLLLLDEPFSNLDAALREALRHRVLARLRAEGTAALMVTHDQSEALQTADRLAVMHAGRLLRIDTPEVIYRAPTTAFVAEFLGGTNLIEGVGAGDRTTTAIGPAPVAAHGPVRLSIRPHAIEVVGDPAGTVEVLARVFGGHEAMLTLQVGGQTIRARVPADHAARVGDRVRLTVRDAALLDA